MVKAFVPAALAAAVVAAAASAGAERPSANCARTSTGLVPLTDLKAGRYGGAQGGLYPAGADAPPKAYLAKGLAAAKLVKPVDGKIVLLSIGMSNTTQEFSAFKRAADVDPHRNPQVTVVDGAQGGQDAEIVKDPSSRFWTVVDDRLAQAGATAKQVQAVWLKEAIAGEQRPFPDDARGLEGDLRTIVGLLKARFPALRLVYVSSRTYAGYATTTLNPEPYAYESGWAVKWLVEEGLTAKLKTKTPWVAWGPYLWTDGTKGRADGFTWTCDDVRADGTHPSPTSGVQKIAALLQRFFATDPTAKSWYLRR